MTKRTQPTSKTPLAPKITEVKRSEAISATAAGCGGCLVSLSMLLVSGLLVFHYGPFLLSLLSNRLHIPEALIVFLCVISWIYSAAVAAAYEEYAFAQRLGLEDIPVKKQWVLAFLNFPLYRVRKQVYLGINLVGAILPVALALYQLRYVPAMPVISTAAAVTLLCYFSVVVLPGRGIVSSSMQFLLISLIGVLVAEAMTSTTDPIVITPSPLSLVPSIAFAGSVLGALVGADLLHLKDVKIKEAAVPLNIGGAGFNDGILKIGLMSLLTAEWFPYIVNELRTRYPSAISDEHLMIALMASTLCLLCAYKIVYGFILAIPLHPASPVSVEARR